MAKFLLLFACIIVLSCISSTDFKKDFDEQQFDQAIVDKLPLFDTLRQLIVSNYDSFNFTGMNNDYTYIHNFDTSSYIIREIPDQVYPIAGQLFHKIGMYNIFGFTLSRDSSLKFLIRTSRLTNHDIKVQESLNWYTTPNKIKRSNFPVKDTILNDNWKYEIWFNEKKRPLF